MPAGPRRQVALPRPSHAPPPGHGRARRAPRSRSTGELRHHLGASRSRGAPSPAHRGWTACDRSPLACTAFLVLSPCWRPAGRRHPVRGHGGPIYFAHVRRRRARPVARHRPHRRGTRGDRAERPHRAPTPRSRPTAPGSRTSQGSDIWVAPTGGGTPERITPREDADRLPARLVTPTARDSPTSPRGTGSPTRYRLKTIDVAKRGHIRGARCSTRAPVLHPSWSTRRATPSSSARYTTPRDPGAQPQVHAVDRATQNPYPHRGPPVPSTNADWAPDGRSIVYEVSDGLWPAAGRDRPAEHLPLFSGTRLPYAGGRHPSSRLRRRRDRRAGDIRQRPDRADRPRRRRPVGHRRRRAHPAQARGTGYGDRSPSWAGNRAPPPPPPPPPKKKLSRRPRPGRRRPRAQPVAEPRPQHQSTRVSRPDLLRLHPTTRQLGEIYSILPGRRRT